MTRSAALDACKTAGVDAEIVAPCSVEVIRNPDLGTVDGIRQSLNTVAARVLNDESLDTAIQGRTIAGLCQVPVLEVWERLGLPEVPLDKRQRVS